MKKMKKMIIFIYKEDEEDEEYRDTPINDTTSALQLERSSTKTMCDFFSILFLERKPLHTLRSAERVRCRREEYEK